VIQGGTVFWALTLVAKGEESEESRSSGDRTSECGPPGSKPDSSRPKESLRKSTILAFIE
jgi:hypothetical protein